MKAKPLRIVIDSREQLPWHFEPEAATVRRGKIDAGDYCLEGDAFFAIERKSLDDFLGTISSGWERFRRELARMDRFVAKVVIVEGTLKDVLDGKHNHSTLTLGFVIKRVARLSLDGVSVIFAGQVEMAAGVGYAILKLRSIDLENLYGDDGENQGDGGTTGTGASVGVQEAGHEMDNPECPKGIGGKMYRQRDSRVRAETR